MQPDLIIKNQPIDIELCGLLGSTQCDFLVLCFDGVQFEDFGTPYDSPANRARWRPLVASLNDRSDESRWPEMWKNWKPQICKQFGLDETTTSDRYRPVVTCKISRVCPAYSEHLHAAIGLFETIADKISLWKITHGFGECVAVAVDKSQRSFLNRGGKMSLVIAQTVCELLRANQDNDQAERLPAKKL